MSDQTFLIKRAPDADDLPLPKYMTPYAAGMDVYANVKKDTVIHPGEIMIVPLGFHMALPRGYEAQIRPRSGLAFKHGISMPNSPGTIDADYRGEVCVLLINYGHEPFTIHRGDRIAQMVINQIAAPVFTEVDELPQTERGANGLGSTGVSL
ncbi:MAG: dUTP diphosphatase [Clostridiales bacterium]|jgi:dUTP pyrophosphatase|nr:dUTP diphosphatase [Clostridiales bacterium]